MSDEFGEADVPATFSHYDERYVAFIDILGFKELIKRSASAGDGQLLHNIFNAMSLGLHSMADDYARMAKVDVQTVDLRVNTFSDFVVISTPSHPQGLDLLCFAVWNVAREWLSKGFLSRGGIAKGKVIHANAKPELGRPATVFGPAFIEAYQLEQDVADYPRVVLSRAVRQDVAAHKTSKANPIAALSKLVMPCDDGPMCLDLFAHLRRNGFSFVGKQQAVEARQFSEALTRQLDEAADTPRFYRRSRWLAERFNQAVAHTAYADLTIELDKR